MDRRAIRTLFVAASLLLITTACDQGKDAKAGAKGDDKAAADAGEKTEVAQPEVGDKPEGAEAGDKPEGAEAGAQPGDSGAAQAEAGEAPAGDEAAVAAEAGGEDGEKDGGEDGDKAEEPKPDKPKDTPKDNGGTASNIDAKGIFSAKCKSCHGADGKGDTTIGKKVDIPSLAKTSMSKAKIISTIEDGVPDTKMKPYKDKLSKEEIEAVAAYVKTL